MSRAEAHSSSSASAGGIGAVGLLQIILICAKLFGYLDDWSWFWVFTPMYFSLTIWLLFLAGLDVLFWWLKDD